MPLRKCILIVDDNAVIRRSLRTVFESAGWDVCGEAVNGHDAIEKASEYQPQVIVLDLAMPEMDGLTASKLLRQLLPTVKLILFTMFGGSTQSDEFRAISAVISKGIPMTVLLKKAEELINAA